MTRTVSALASILFGAFAVAACTDDPPRPEPEPPVEPVCGNGLLEENETCEGMPVPDGCSPSSCRVQSGWECLPDPPPPAAPEPATGDGAGTGGPMAPEWDSTCALIPICNNGLIEEGEECDDEDNQPGDGCDPDCQIEDGFSCSGEPTECAACGDGFIDEGEACDDGVLLGNSSAGCSEECAVVDGWECSGEPSLCGPICGDGMLFNTTVDGVSQGFAEECDDGNNDPGDGCDADCDVEDGWECSFQAMVPSVCEVVVGTSSSGSSGGDSSGSGSSGSDSGTTGGSSGSGGSSSSSTTGM